MRLFTLTTLLPLLAVVSAAPSGPRKCGPKHSGSSSATISPPVSGVASTVAVPSETPIGIPTAEVPVANGTDTAVPSDLPTDATTALVIPTTAASSIAVSSASAAAPSASTTPASNGNNTAAETPQAESKSSGPLFDTSVSIEARQKALASMSDDDVLASVGTPKLAGPSQHHAVLKATICKVARLSVFHAQQVRDVIGWGVEFQAHADASATTSYFQSSTSSEDSAAEGTDGAHGADAGGLFLAQDVDETLLSHEMGHAVFHNHKFAAPMEAAVKSAGLADTQKYGQVTAVINEAFANFFAERAAVYMRTQRSQKEWDAWTSHSLGHGFDWILENGDGTTNFWFTSLDCTQATVDAKPLITKTADGVVFPRLAELYNLDQKREYAP